MKKDWERSIFGMALGKFQIWPSVRGLNGQFGEVEWKGLTLR
jgi:hypothetical protein